MTIERDFTDLLGKRVLIVEDEPFLAERNAEAVRRAGGTVLGPVPDVDGAMAILAKGDVDGAVIDVHLGEEISLPVTSALRERSVPIIFVTGYDDWFLSEDFDEVAVGREPADTDGITRAELDLKPEKPLSEGD